MADADLLVHAEGVSKSYGRGRRRSEIVLLDAGFEIRRHDRIALVGPSGSGKSTLVHLIAALDDPTAGTIEWPGLAPRDRLRPGSVGVAFQGPSLLPPLTVVENVALPLLLLDRSQREANAEAFRLIRRFDLRSVAQKLPEELSGGQLQRAALVRALAGEPSLVLADEPTGQQDRRSGHRILTALLLETRRTGAAVLVATHDRSVAERLGRTWTLRDGRLFSPEVIASSP
jgi:ABC-type lipoprotein export system ATPase subunit